VLELVDVYVNVILNLNFLLDSMKEYESSILKLMEQEWEQDDISWSREVLHCSFLVHPIF